MSDIRVPNVKVAVKRASRPAILKRRTTPGDSSPKATHAAVHENASGLEKVDMAASFLQFCANCEKQIMTPSNAILYCSEACRRKDSKKPLTMSSPPVSHNVTPPSCMPSSPRPILTQRSSAGVHSYPYAPSSRIPVELHNGKSDLDPTEWKPKLHVRTESEAYRYLSQFHRSGSTISELNERRERGEGGGVGGVGGGAVTFALASTSSGITTPSLATTPTTTSSSWSADYDFSNRPLQPRHNPVYSASAGMTRGIDLVTPHMLPPPDEVSTGSVPAVVLSPGAWEKKRIIRASANVGNGLGLLFGGSTPT